MSRLSERIYFNILKSVYIISTHGKIPSKLNKHGYEPDNLVEGSQKYLYNKLKAGDLPQTICDFIRKYYNPEVQVSKRRRKRRVVVPPAPVPAVVVAGVLPAAVVAHDEEWKNYVMRIGRGRSYYMSQDPALVGGIKEFVGRKAAWFRLERNRIQGKDLARIYRVDPAKKVEIRKAIHDNQLEVEQNWKELFYLYCVVTNDRRGIASYGKFIRGSK